MTPEMRLPVDSQLSFEAVANSPIPLGEIFAGKYRIDSVLGEGGMGIVVAAHHIELDQKVAIKFLLDDLSDNQEGAERFRREARAAAKIQSDHVVRVIDVGLLDSGERYMVMECLDGRDLAEEIAIRKTFPFGTAAVFILEAIDAVGQAHAVGIVHRDLKPANLFLAERQDGTQRIKVLDFGISKSVGNATAAEMSLTKTSAWIGSPLYMAPEQMQSARDVDQRADIWSLGAILYELISGRTPYVADSLPQLCNLLITQDPPPIQSICPEVPDGLARAVMGCLIRDPNARIQTTSELAQHLSQYATTVTGSGMRQSLLDRTEMHMGPASGAMASMGPGLSPGTQGAPAPARGAENPLAASGAATILSGDSGVGQMTAQSGTGTASAWGGTDAHPQQKSSKTVPAIIAFAAVAAAVGFFLSRGSGGDAEETQSPIVAVEEAPPTPAKAAEKLEVEVPTPQASAAADPAPSAQEESPVQATAPVVAPAPAQTAPRPRPRPRPKNPPPKSDDFSDFGGRR